MVPGKCADLREATLILLLFCPTYGKQSKKKSKRKFCRGAEGYADGLRIAR